MNIFMYRCSKDRLTLLLVPTREIPEQAKQECDGTWIFDKVLEDFTGENARIALSEADALADINSKGYYIGKAQITSTVTVLPRRESK